MELRKLNGEPIRDKDILFGLLPYKPIIAFFAFLISFMAIHAVVDKETTTHELFGFQFERRDDWEEWYRQSGFGGTCQVMFDDEVTGATALAYTVGDYLHTLNVDPPTPTDVYRGVMHVSYEAGRLWGTMSAAVKGAEPPTEKVPLPEPPSREQLNKLISATGCSPCPTGDSSQPVAAGGEGINLVARAALTRWQGEDAVVATAVAMGESGGDPEAANDSSSARGLWQTMMSYHAPKYERGEHWSDPYDNAEVAHEIWRASGWQPWVVYTEGTYLQHMDAARAAVERAGGDGNVITAAVTQDAASDGCGQVASVGWAAGGGRLVDWDGEQVEAHTAQMLRDAGRILGGRISVTQGSYSTDVEQSGGTHDGGGVIDVGAPVGSWDATVAAMRESGFIAWHRTPDQGDWNDHIHAIDPSSPNLSPEAAGQVEAFRNGGDGLGNYDTAVAGE